VVELYEEEIHGEELVILRMHPDKRDLGHLVFEKHAGAGLWYELCGGLMMESSISVRNCPTITSRQ